MSSIRDKDTVTANKALEKFPIFNYQLFLTLSLVQHPFEGCFRLALIRQGLDLLRLASIANALRRENFIFIRLI